MKIVMETPGIIMPHQRHYQVGNIIKIRREPLNARRTGFLLGTIHVIVEPPKGYLNCGGHVWLNDKKGHPRCIKFYEYSWTGKIKRVRKN